MDTDGRALEAVLGQLDSSWEDTLSRIMDLVRIPSVVGSEGIAQEYMASLYSGLGLELDVFEADEVEGLYSHPAYCGLELPVKTRYRGRPNVVGTLTGQPGGRSLILNGHIDVVSAQPEEEWSSPPWDPVIADGWMTGRGASDMKSGLIAAWAALKAVLDAGYLPEGTVKLESVIEEEAGGGGGALACFLRGHTADAFLAVEPTGLNLRIGNGGILYFRVKVQGRTAHAGNAHMGVNAIEKMGPLLEALFRLDEVRARERSHPLFEVGSMGRPCHLNIGSYRAGDWPSTVAGWAEIQGRVGFLPEENREEVMSQVEDAIRETSRRDTWLREHPPSVEWFGWKADPWVEDPDDPFITHLASRASLVMGREVSKYARTSGVDSRFAHMFNSVGVCFGPRGENNHGVDERVEIESVRECARVLAALILSWCGYSRR